MVSINTPPSIILEIFFLQEIIIKIVRSFLDAAIGMNG